MNTITKNSVRHWFFNSALVVGSVLIALVVAELSLRAVGFNDPVLWTYDDLTGSRLLPGAQGWYRAEGEAYVKISSAGLRDREHAIAKPPNAFRIAVLGDSMAEALQVPQEEAFWSVLENRLKACGRFSGREVEVLNFGVSGYGTAQQFLTFRHRAAAYAPDVTVLAFYPGNDVRNNSKALEPSKLRPFFTVADGRLVADNTFLNSAEYQSYKAGFDRKQPFFDFRLFQLARKTKAVWTQYLAGAGADAGPGSVEPGLNDEVFLVPIDGAWREAWSVTEHLLVATRDEVQAHGGRFIVVTVPIGIQAFPDAKVRERFTQVLGVPDLWYPERRLAGFLQRAGIDTLTMGPRFLGEAEQHGTYLFGFKNTALGTGHLNAAGHRLIGEALADHLCDVR